MCQIKLFKYVRTALVPALKLYILELWHHILKVMLSIPWCHNSSLHSLLTWSSLALISRGKCILGLLGGNRRVSCIAFICKDLIARKLPEKQFCLYMLYNMIEKHLSTCYPAAKQPKHKKLSDLRIWEQTALFF